MTDQEQTERGASMISGSVTWTPYDETIRQLRADLELVTAERDQANAVLDSVWRPLVASLRAERDAMREALLKIEEIASRPSIADEERMSMVWQIVVLSLDATRKAMADATEKGK